MLWPVSDGIYGRRGTRNQDIFQKLKHRSEMQPDKHDGSYELVRGIVSAYRDADESVLDYHDLNAVYLMCIGTWRHSYEKKRASIQDTHLSHEQKQKLNQLIDDLKGWAQAGLYSNQENGASGTGNIGMFGTGFCSFQDKTDVKSVRAVIKLCIDIPDMTDDEEMFRRAALVCTKSFHGMQAAAASVVLHCLKPFTFPVINSNAGNGDIFAALGVELKSQGKLVTYIENCRIIKAFRDDNFSFKIIESWIWRHESCPQTLFSGSSANIRIPLKHGFPRRYTSGGRCSENVIEVLDKHGFSAALPARGTKGPYVFIMDEINRGSISKIFGEQADKNAGRI